MKILKRIIVLAAAVTLSMSVLSSCNNREPVTLTKKENPEKIQRENGIVCWGSSIGFSTYGNSYVKTVEDHMMTDECYIPIVNMSVPKESTKTVMARAGIIKILVNKAFVLPEGIEPVEITFKAEDDSDIFPLRYGTACDGGMTDVTIAGIKGTLSVARDSAQLDQPKYYFTRKVEGKKIKINKGEQIISESMTSYSEYIPVIGMGESGEWTKLSELVQQQQAIINTCDNKDKYVILGMFSVPLEEDKTLTDEEQLKRQMKANEDFDKYMKKKWGEHYISVREYLCSEKAVEKAKAKDIKFDKKDLANIKRKIVPDALKYDNNSLHAVAYEIIGDAVYDKLVELGYLYH